MVEPEGQAWGPREAAPAVGEFRAWPPPDGTCTDQKLERRAAAPGWGVQGGAQPSAKAGTGAGTASVSGQSSCTWEPPSQTFTRVEQEKQTHTACRSCPEHLHSRGNHACVWGRSPPPAPE